IKYHVAELLPGCASTKLCSPDTRSSVFPSIRVSSIESPIKTLAGFSLEICFSSLSSNCRRGAGPKANNVGTPSTTKTTATTPNHVQGEGGGGMGGDSCIKRAAKLVELVTSAKNQAQGTRSKDFHLQAHAALLGWAEGPRQVWRLRRLEGRRLKTAAPWQ